VNIRTFQRGDEEAQAAIYNEAAGDLPRFKPASAQEVTRRAAAADFDPSMRFYAIENGKPVAYAVFNPNGRVSYPWCRKGHEQLAVPLFDHMMQAMAQRGFRKAFAAYRGDWPVVLDFLRGRGFAVAREMVSFVIELVSMPTMPSRPSGMITPVERRDVPALFALAPKMLRSANAEELERHLFANPYFPADSVFVLRSRSGGAALAAGILVHQMGYANPKAVDASMPCFRLGAFGTEGMQVKRINGMFSFLCRDDAQCGGMASDLLSHAAHLLQESDDIAVLGAQVPSDVPNLLRYYQMTWSRQGSFPVLEINLPR